jgi:hypothetical protein
MRRSQTNEGRKLTTHALCLALSTAKLMGPTPGSTVLDNIPVASGLIAYPLNEMSASV